MADTIQTSYGFDPNVPAFPQVPMSSASVTARGPDRRKTLVGYDEAGQIDRINENTDAMMAAQRAEAEARAAQNTLESERKAREAQILRGQRRAQEGAEVEAQSRREQRQRDYDSEQQGYFAEHGGPQGFWDKHGAGDKVLAGIAIGLGGIGRALQMSAGINPGENAGLRAVNGAINQWHSDRQKQLDIDREKLLKSKARIDEVDKWYEREKLRNEAKFGAELTAIAREFDSQAASAKNPEVRAKAEQEAAKYRAEAEKQKQFAMEGQRETVNEAGVTMSRSNTAPGGQVAASPGIPRVPGAGQVGPAGSLAPGAAAPRKPTDPLSGISEMPKLQMPVGEQAPERPVMGTADMMKLKAPGELGGRRRAAQPGGNQADPAAVAPMAGTTGAAGNKPVSTDEVNRRALAGGGVIYGHKGKPIGAIEDKKLAQDVNKQTAALVDYAGAIAKLGDAADAWNRMMLSPKSAGDVAAAKARFDQAYKDVRNKAKGAVATDALSDQEALAAVPIDRAMVLAGKHRESIDETFAALRTKIGGIYSSVGLDPDVAFTGLIGKQAPAKSDAMAASPAKKSEAPDQAMIERAREAAKEDTPRGSRARAWLKENGL